MSEYKELADEKSHKIGCIGHLMGIIKDDVPRLLRNDVRYKIETVPKDNDHMVIMLVDNPGNSGIVSGAIAMSVSGRVDEKQVWWNRKQLKKYLLLDIIMYPPFLPNIKESDIKNLFKYHENEFQESISTNSNLKKAEVKMNFHKIQ